jgi:hypothetical protein
VYVPIPFVTDTIAVIVVLADIPAPVITLPTFKLIELLGSTLTIVNVVPAIYPVDA